MRNSGRVDVWRAVVLVLLLVVTVCAVLCGMLAWRLLRDYYPSDSDYGSVPADASLAFEEWRSLSSEPWTPGWTGVTCGLAAEPPECASSRR